MTTTEQIVKSAPGRWISSRPAPSPRAIREVNFIWLTMLLAVIVLEGALRKWILPTTLQPLAYGAKDIMATLFILKYPLPYVLPAMKRVRTAAYVVGVVLLPAFILGLTHDPLSAISTYKNAVLWPVFAVHLAPRLNGRIVVSLLPVLALVSCGMAVLGAIQFESSPTALINRYAWNDVEASLPVATFGTIAGTRASGTFSYISGMSEFSVFCFSIALWLSLQTTGYRQKLFAGLAVTASVCCALESGSRAPAVFFVGMFVAATLVAKRVQVLLRIWGVLLCIGLVLTYILGATILTAFVDRWETATDTIVGRATGEGLRANYVELILAHPVGIGLGRTTGYEAYRGYQTDNVVDAYDDGSSTAVLEAGLLGLVGWCVTIVPVVVLVLAGLRSNSHQSRSATGIVGLFSAYLVWTCIWRDHTCTAFTWLSIAIWLSCLHRQGVSATGTYGRGLRGTETPGYPKSVARRRARSS